MHRPPASQTENPVMGLLPMSPQVAPAATNWAAWQVPTGLPLAAGMQIRPRSLSQLGAVLRERVEPKLLAVRTVSPAMAVLRPVADEEEHGSHR